MHSLVELYVNYKAAEWQTLVKFEILQWTLGLKDAVGRWSKVGWRWRVRKGRQRAKKNEEMGKKLGDRVGGKKKK